MIAIIYSFLTNCFFLIFFQVFFRNPFWRGLSFFFNKSFIFVCFLNLLWLLNKGFVQNWYCLFRLIESLFWIKYRFLILLNESLDWSRNSLNWCFCRISWLFNNSSCSWTQKFICIINWSFYY